ncbi:MAG: 9-O-acetylesterase, partial [Planctomycetes bacterium]|nr:9-O-acetylesterase [Planctomycetota bacterium]
MKLRTTAVVQRRRSREWFVWGVALLVFSTAARADVKVPALFGDHMVLQQKSAIPVWGWADPGEAVTVTLGDRSASTKADAEGHWLVKLEGLRAGGPLELVIRGKNTIRISDVLV